MPPVLAHNPLGAQRAWAARARWGMCYLPGVPGLLGGGAGAWKGVRKFMKPKHCMRNFVCVFLFQWYKVL